MSPLWRYSCSPASIARPRPRAAQPMWVSRIWPTFIRLGTPSGFSTRSTGVPSARNGMSSSGTTREITPLLPWRPAILSPGWSLRFTAMKTLTIFITPGGRSSPRRTFSTLSSKRRSSAFFCSSNWPCSASCACASASSPRASCHHWPRESVPSSSSSMVEPALMPFGPFTAVLPRIRSLQARVDVALEDRELVVAVAAETLDLLALDLQRALVLVDAVPVEDPDLDDRAVVARRQPERGVADVGRLLAEDGAEELFLRRHRAIRPSG